MASVQLREFTSAAEVMANARAINARIAASRLPRPAPKVAAAPKPQPAPALVTLAPTAAPPVLRPLHINLVDEIVRIVCRFYGISRFDIYSRRRLAAIVFPRQVAMYLAKNHTTKTYPEIGRRFDNRDHTTVLHAVRKIDALRKTDAKLNADLLALEIEIDPPAPPPESDPNQLALPLAGEGG